MNTELPDNLRAMLASSKMRMFHYLWHFVRNEEAWNSLPSSDRKELIQLGWEAPKI